MPQRSTYGDRGRLRGSCLVAFRELLGELRIVITYPNLRSLRKRIEVLGRSVSLLQMLQLGSQVSAVREAERSHRKSKEEKIDVARSIGGQ